MLKTISCSWNEGRWVERVQQLCPVFNEAWTKFLGTSDTNVSQHFNMVNLQLDCPACDDEFNDDDA